MRTIILDNEAVEALLVPEHGKHRAVMAHLAAVVARRKRNVDVRVVVPTAVRVEAGWNRAAPRSAIANRLRIVDAPLDTDAANRAASIVERTGVSVADAHTGAVAAPAAGDVVVLTSDPDDVRRASAPKPIVAVRI